MAESGVCTSCGAALPHADALGLITCPGCGQVTKLPGSSPEVDPPVGTSPVPPAPNGPPEAPALQGWPAPPVAAPSPGGQWAAPAPVAGAPPAPTPPPSRSRRSSKTSGAKAGKRIGCTVVPIAVAAVVLFGVIGAVRSCDVSSVTSSFNGTEFDPSQLTLSGSGTLLPADDGDADMVMILQESKDSQTTRRVARIAFQGDASKLVWQSEPLGDEAYRAEVALVGDTLFAGVDDQLYALDAKTGTTRWQTTLRDKLTSACEDCFAAADGKLVVRTTDAYVTAYGTASSESLWEKRLVSTSGSISVVGDRLFVVDEPESDDALTPVALVDPANGKTIRSTTPRCPKGQSSWDLEMSPGDPVRPVPGSKDVMAVFGFGDSCVVRWDPDTSAIKWTSRLTDLGSLDEDSIVVGERDLVVGNSSGQLVTVYLPNGKAKLLASAAAADLTAQPSTIVGRTLVALTVTTRGTPKGGLAAWDLATGERIWANASLGTAQPVSTGGFHSSDALFDGTPRSVLVPDGDGLNAFVFEGTNRTFSAAPVDLATGKLGTEVRRPFLARYDSGTPSLTIEGTTKDRLMVSIDNLLQSIPVSGKGDIVSFPEKN